MRSDNNTDKTNLFLDGAIRARGQGKRIESSISRDGVLHLGDGRNVTALSNCILTCVRLWKGAMTEGEVNLEYGKKKCDDHERVSITWPLFKRGNLKGSQCCTDKFLILVRRGFRYEPSLILLAK